METISVIAPLGEDYSIDDFLKNVLQVKIDGEWHYLNNIDLPSMDLKIVEVHKRKNEAEIIIQLR